MIFLFFRTFKHYARLLDDVRISASSDDGTCFLPNIGKFSRGEWEFQYFWKTPFPSQEVYCIPQGFFFAGESRTPASTVWILKNSEISLKSNILLPCYMAGFECYENAALWEIQSHIFNFRFTFQLPKVRVLGIFQIKIAKMSRILCAPYL